MTVKAVLTDIEGTTSSIRFVKDILFPYAAKEIPAFLRKFYQQEQVKDLIEETARIAALSADDIESVIKQLQQWIQDDLKITPLKTLQGLVWEAGYREVHYKAHLYADACESLRHWHEQGILLYVYSSGSVYAQKLFFGHTEYGDLTHLFSGYFDTTSGSKKEVASYIRIAGEIGLPPQEILFLSDIVEELDAAKDAGMQTYWLVRDQDTTVTISDLRNACHAFAASFEALDLNAKRSE